MTIRKKTSLPSPGWSRLIEILDAISLGQAAVPSSLFSKKAASLPKRGKDLLTRKCPSTDDLTIEVSEALWSDLDCTWVNWRFCTHRIAWFRSLAQLFFNFSKEDKLRRFVPDFVRGLKGSLAWDPAKVVDCIKYYTVAVHAKFIGSLTKMPLVPDCINLRPGASVWRLFGGQLGRWLSHRIIQTSTPFGQRFFYSWFQSKRGCATMDEQDMEETYLKHKKSLFQPPSEISPQLEGSLRYWTRSFFKGRPVSLPTTVNFEYSHHACFTHSRKKGGAAAAVHQVYGLSLEEQRLLEKDDSLYLRNFTSGRDEGSRREYWFNREREQFVEDIDFLPAALGDILFSFYRDEDFRPDPKRKFQTYDCYGNPSLLVEGLSRHSYKRLCNLAFDLGDDKVMVSGVLEPLKVRTITEGDPLTYAATMPIQKHLHRRLKHLDQFRLIGRPLKRKDLTFISDHPTSRWLRTIGPTIFVSGDYSGATDTVSSHATHAVWDELKLHLNLPEEVVAICSQVLLEQEIHYPKRFRIEPFRQINGQLMGSTLSFPILCIINFVCYAVALSDYFQELGINRNLRFEDVNAFINGDDLLSEMTERLYEIWQLRIKEAGFKMSPGKSLAHPYIATINSEQFCYRDGQWYETPYLNIGLLINGGSGKIARLSSRVKTHDLTSVWNEFRVGTFSQTRGWSQFLRYHKSALFEYSKQGLLNLFAPVLLGGCGMDPPVAKEGERVFEVRWTLFQRALAKEILLEPRHIKSGVGFVPTLRYTNVDIVEKFPYSVLGRSRRTYQDGQRFKRLIVPSEFTTMIDSDDDFEIGNGERDNFGLDTNTCNSNAERILFPESEQDFNLRLISGSSIKRIRRILNDRIFSKTFLATPEELLNFSYKRLEYRQSNL